MQFSIRDILNNNTPANSLELTGRRSNEFEKDLGEIIKPENEN